MLIPDEDAVRNKLTLCISSQVGCAIDCRFCATATLGFGRHLGAGEIVAQVYRATALAGRRPTNLVFMGMGEPLHNFDNVARALALLEHPWGAGFSPRRLTVSTAGLVPGIDKLGALKPAPNLAISLNATTDEIRERIMPINKKWPLAALLDAARRFPLSHGRRVTFEYVLLAGVNDSDADADRLPRLLRGIPAKVNLIPWNPFQGPEFKRPSAERIRTFQERLRAAEVSVYIRSPRGDDIDAACGQLAARELVQLQPSPRMSAADALDEARALATDACGRIAEFWGFTRTMGRAFGLLYLSREPLPQADIQARLGISAGSASMTLAALGRWGVVHKIWVRGQRREHYQAETDFWKMISGVLNERERREISAAVDVVSRAEASARAAQAAVRGPARVDADFVVDRVARLGEICRNGETMLDMLLGQLTLDVARFRDVLKVTPANDAARR